MPNTLYEHIKYTENEWNNVDYFINVLNFLENKNIKKVLDVGGCTGKVSSILIEKIPSIEKIIILEPIEENFNFIKKEMELLNKVEIMQKALYYGKTQIQLGQCDDNVGGWSFEHSMNKTDYIQTITLEQFFDIDFLKMDIEGSEKNVIENSTYIHDIPYLEIEFHFDLWLDWKEFVIKNLTNHEIKFTSLSNRSNCFLVRKDLI